MLAVASLGMDLVVSTSAELMYQGKMPSYGTDTPLLVTELCVWFYFYFIAAVHVMSHTYILYMLTTLRFFVKCNICGYT